MDDVKRLFFVLLKISLGDRQLFVIEITSDVISIT